MNMKRLPFALLIVSALYIFGCDSNPASFEDSIPIYSLTTNVTPETGGTIHPSGGEFRSGDNIVIEARPADGFIFDRWENDLSGNTNPDTLQITANRTVTAYFSRRDYTLNIDISGEGVVHETVAESDTSDYSVKSVKLTAEAEEGWFFDRWEGDLSGSDNPEIVSVDEEKNITAVFDREIEDGYTITINIEGEGSVDKSPNRTYFAEGDEVILTANPESEWSFVEWRGDLTGSNNSQTVVIEGDLEATAVFGPFEDPFLEINQQPSTTNAGATISPAPEVKLTDEVGDPIEGAEIEVTLNKNSFASGSTLIATTNSAGIATFDDLSIETATTGYIMSFEADVDDVADISTNPFEIVAAEADASSSSADVPSEGSVGESIDITIQLEDAFGNVVTGAADDISISISGANSGSPSVSEENDGEYIASYTPTHAGSDEITISVNGNEIPGSPFSSDVSGGAPSEMNITQQPSRVTAGSAISSSPAVRVLDSFGNTLEDIEVTVELEGGNFASGSTTSAETNSSGVATFSNLVIHSAGSGYSLNFIINGLEKSSDSFEVVAASPDPSSSMAEVPNGVTGEETVITITLEDQFGNAVSGAESGLSVNISGSNSDSPSVSETGNSGEYTASYTPMTAGTDQIEIRYDGSSIEGSPFSSTVEPADPNASNSTVTVDPDQVKVGEASTVTVEVRDDNGNLIGGLSNSDFGINLEGDASGGSVSETSSTGIYEFDVTSEEIGDVTVTVTVHNVTLSDRPVITFEAGDPHEIIITVQPEDTQSGEPINGPPTVRVLDEFGHNVPDVDVRVREESGHTFSSGDLIVTTDESGIAVFDNLVIHTRIRWFHLVFSVDGVEDVVSDRFRVSFLERSEVE